MGVCNSQPSAGTLVSTAERLLSRENLNQKEENQLQSSMAQIKAILRGDVKGTSTQSQNSLAQELIDKKIVSMIISKFEVLEFETVKDGVTTINCLINDHIGIAKTLFEKDGEVMNTLASSCSNVKIAMHCNSILKSCISDPNLLTTFLDNNYFKFIDFVQLPTFDVASENFSTLKTALTNNKEIVGKFLASNVDKVLDSWLSLLNATNQVTKRYAIPLVTSLLEEKENASVRQAFVNSEACCRKICEILTNSSKVVQKEVLSVFVLTMEEVSQSTNKRVLAEYKDKVLESVLQFEAKEIQPTQKDDDDSSEGETDEIKKPADIKAEQNANKTKAFYSDLDLSDINLQPK